MPSKYNWSHEEAHEINKNLKRDMIMYDGMSGKPFAVCFPFTIGNYLITTPQEWAWAQKQLEGWEPPNNASTRTGIHSADQADTVKSPGSGDEPEPSNSARR